MRGTLHAATETRGYTKMWQRRKGFGSAGLPAGRLTFRRPLCLSWNAACGMPVHLPTGFG